MSDDNRGSRAGAALRRGRPRTEHGLAFKVFWRTVLGLFTLFVLGFVVLLVIYLRTPIPQPQANAGKQLSIVYYDDGKTELGRFSTVNRQDVQLSQVPQQVRYEFLAAEDRNFYKNSGVSFSGTVRAAWKTLTGGGEQGGSTITQQYVKNYFLTQDRSVKRKVKEIMISLKIDQKYSKDQILQDYLNNIYFGRGAYGIQAASQAYFGVDVEKLNPSQGAFLASVINAPGLYDPQYGEAAAARANARMVYVLDGMVKEGWMTQAERDKQQFPTFKPYKPAGQSTPGPNGYIVASVRNELQTKLKLSPEDIDRGGLRITTTIQKPAQDAAVAAVNKSVPSEVARLDQLRTGLFAQKPDGAVVAMYGGTDISKAPNAATYAQLQGGSSFKTFALAAALQDGMTMQTRFSGASPLVLNAGAGKTNKVTNDHGEQYGSLTLDQAFAVSSNTAFVRLNQQLGTGKTLAAAQQLGIPAKAPGMNDPSAVDVLGYAAVHVSDMANAYNTISAEGKKASPYFIQKVSSQAGAYDYTAHPNTTQALDKDLAANLANGMQGPLDGVGGYRGTAESTAGTLGRPAGGKTGTTGANGKFIAAWFTGFTPNQLTTSVGMYAGDGTKALNQAGESFYGGDIPGTIWRDFMSGALKGQPVAKMPKTKDVTPSVTNTPPPVTQTQGPTATSTTPPTSSAPPSPTTSSAPPSTSTATTPSTTPSTTQPTGPTQPTQPTGPTQPTQTQPTPTTQQPTTQAPSRPTQPQTPPAASGAPPRAGEQASPVG
ncbi:penicillin-binding protein [Flexivirga sp. ID2601S]|uniref:Penicillin-binding protein n=1 Tax=Flexivirga aerilata TaxID=1656889 RepID=A0A849AJA0_9MICO|nr:penicillin-binding protein [Flexivirga aerilata]